MLPPVSAESGGSRRKPTEEPMQSVQNQSEVSRTRSFAASAVAWAIILVSAAMIVPSALAQTFTVLYTFTHTTQGWQPDSAPMLDAAGNLYGTTHYGGTAGAYGTVFKLSRACKLTLLHSFASNPDGADPYSTLIGDPHGNGYGTTRYGGAAGGYGT